MGEPILDYLDVGASIRASAFDRAVYYYLGGVQCYEIEVLRQQQFIVRKGELSENTL